MMLMQKYDYWIYFNNYLNTNDYIVTIIIWIY